MAMTLTAHARTRATTAAILTAFALAVAACDSGSASSGNESTPTPTPGESASATPEPGPERPQETRDPHPRLIVAHEGSVTVLNGRNLDVMMSIPVEGIAEPTVSSDDRHVYIASRSGGDVIVLDAGSYALPHVGHAHYYIVEPALLGISLATSPSAYFVAGSDHTAIFDRTTGTTSHFNDVALISGELDIATIDGTAHHGVAVPIGNGQSLISSTSDGETASSISRVSESGDILDTSPECQSLGGETTTLRAVAFGCQGSVLVYEDDAFRSIQLDSDDHRITRLSGTTHSDVLLVGYSETEIALIDLSQDSVQVVDLGVRYADLARGADSEAIVLGADGAIRIIDPETGDIDSTIPSIDAFPVGADASAPQPGLVVMEHLAFVTDVAASRVVAIDVYEGAFLAEVALPSEPYGIVATNTAWLRGGANDHGPDRTNEDGHTLDELDGL